MRLKRLDGRYVNKCCLRYLIHWHGESRSKLQERAKKLLHFIWAADIVFEEFPVFGTKMKVDFFNATRKIAVEVNGPQHEKFNKFFHGNRYGFVKGIDRDCIKADWLELNDIRLVEVVEKDLYSFQTLYKRLYPDVNI